MYIGGINNGKRGGFYLSSGSFHSDLIYGKIYKKYETPVHNAS